MKELRRLPAETQIGVLEAVAMLHSAPMKGRQLSGQWKGLRRLRVGSIRVIYGFDGRKLLVSVLRVGHRREVYRA